VTDAGMSALSDDNKVNLTDDRAVTRTPLHRFFLRVVINIAEKTDKSIMYIDSSGLILLLKKGDALS
jgi:hypothetical protein